MTTYRIMDGVSGRPGVGSSGTQPPSAGTSYSGNYQTGLVFQVTQGGIWLQGYWWWVPSTVSQTGAQAFCLWQVYNNGGGTLVPNSSVTSGTLTAGAWNYVALATPIMLSPEFAYVATTAFNCTTGFPLTTNQFGSGDPYVSGITNGPLFAFPSGAAASGGMCQMPLDTATSDPTTNMPSANDHDDLMWIDVQVSDQAPANATYRMFPNLPSGATQTTNIQPQTGAYTLATEFSLTSACKLMKIWHYSPSGATVLPSRCAIWNVGSQTVVTGTDNASPTWSGAAGSGWVYCDYSASGVTLSAGVNYKVSTFSTQAVSNWFANTVSFWGTSQFLPSGFTAGPLSVPGNATASPGQSSWNPSATLGYPNTSTTP